MNYRKHGGQVFILDRNVREVGQISTLDIFDQTSGNESIWARLYNWESGTHSERQ